MSDDRSQGTAVSKIGLIGLAVMGQVRSPALSIHAAPAHCPHHAA